MGTTARSPMISPARTCAYAVIRRVFEEGAYADRAFHAEARALDGRDRAFAMALAYGTVQRAATLDHVIDTLSDRPARRLDPPIRAALRLGLMQLLFLDGVAEHAAVHESVELAKRHARGGAGLVNAVLRRAGRAGRAELLGPLSDATAQDAAVMHSVPPWLAEMWWRELGAERARALLAAINRPAESALRANTLATTRDAVAAAIPVACRASPELPEGLVLEGPFDAHGSPEFERGLLMPQSRASMLVSRALAPEPGQRVLDLCAAPGGKTTHLAALMEDTGGLRAVERHAGRARALENTLARMRVTCAQVDVADAAVYIAADGVTFDRVLVDPPCSGLGTLQSRPDLRWRASPEAIPTLAAQQAAILSAGAALVASGGALVYSVCTISHSESDGVVAEFLRKSPAFALDAEPARPAPDRDGTDGFFIARLSRR